VVYPTAYWTPERFHSSGAFPSKQDSFMLMRLRSSFPFCRFPAQEHVGGDNKIPSIIYYGQEGNVRAVGAETQQPHVIEEAAKEQWIRLEWYVKTGCDE